MRRDDGFTLVELLITTVIIGIISAAISTAFVFGLRTLGNATDRVSYSHDAQILSAYFVRDVQSAGAARVTNSSCGGPGAGETQLIWFTWAQHAAVVGDPAISKISSYVINDTGRRLERRRCENGALVGTEVVAHSLATATNPAVTCSPSACANSTEPKSIKIEVTAPALTGSIAGNQYVYSITAHRRAT